MNKYFLDYEFQFNEADNSFKLLEEIEEDHWVGVWFSREADYMLSRIAETPGLVVPEEIAKLLKDWQAVPEQVRHFEKCFPDEAALSSWIKSSYELGMNPLPALRRELGESLPVEYNPGDWSHSEGDQEVYHYGDNLVKWFPKGNARLIISPDGEITWVGKALTPEAEPVNPEAYPVRRRKTAPRRRKAAVKPAE